MQSLFGAKEALFLYKNVLEVHGDIYFTDIDDTLPSILMAVYAPILKKENRKVAIDANGVESVLYQNARFTNTILVSNTFVTKDVESTLKSVGFVFLKTQSVFVKQQTGESVCFALHKERNVTVIFTNQGHQETLHVCYGLLPMIAPWLGVPDEIGMAILKEFANAKLRHNHRLLSVAMSNILNDDTLAEQRLRSIVEGLSASRFEEELRGVENSYVIKQDSIKALMEQLREAQDFIEKLCDRKEVLENKIRNGDNIDEELFRYLKSQKNIKNLTRSKVNGHTKLSFIAVGDLDYIDESMYKAYIVKGTRNSSIIDKLSVLYSSDTIRKFFQYCWGNEQRYHIQVYADFSLSDDGFLSRNNDTITSSAVWGNRLPAPHIMLYNCFGSFQNMVVDAQRNHDFIAAFNVAQSCVRNLNLTDGIVCDSFASRLANQWHDKKVIRDNDGNLFSLDEVMKQIAEEGE